MLYLSLLARPLFRPRSKVWLRLSVFRSDTALTFSLTLIVRALSSDFRDEKQKRNTPIVSTFCLFHTSVVIQRAGHIFDHGRTTRLQIHVIKPERAGLRSSNPISWDTLHSLVAHLSDLWQFLLCVRGSTASLRRSSAVLVCVRGLCYDHQAKSMVRVPLFVGTLLLFQNTGQIGRSYSA
jgi:hypothetical protein